MMLFMDNLKSHKTALYIVSYVCNESKQPWMERMNAKFKVKIPSRRKSRNNIWREYKRMLTSLVKFYLSV